jgi:divalent metal cation (Fe/Co/Zn/Cd) transporter
MDTVRSHHLAHLVEKAIADSLNASVVVHVDPVDPSESAHSLSERQGVEDELTDIVMRHPSVKSFHDLTISTTQGMPTINLHLVIDGDLSVEASHDMGHQIVDAFKERLGDCQVNLHIEPK